VRAVLQRVTRASVTVDGTVVGRIGPGFLALVGVRTGDTDSDAAWLADRIAGLRVFPDDTGKMNVSVRDAGGSVLVVSQFTLYADSSRGRRPSFAEAAPPDVAEPLVDAVCRELRERGVPVETGVFGAMMDVDLLNAGPVTIVLDSGAATR